MTQFNATSGSIIIRLEARLRLNKIHVEARYDGVHAFRYNSAESEPISMKSGTL